MFIFRRVYYTLYSPFIVDGPSSDALGNPTGFLLTPSQAHEVQGADALLPKLETDQLLADKAYDADTRVLKLLKRQRD